ncbi:hypothetical protein V6N11_049553 [Hibiscus sabdariffa]|uniref:Uncharacterized protein n=1 Tax=Hibiscus sabdariffa TaxID=183260 RepID=A0ABR2NML8_9ROSI
MPNEWHTPLEVPGKRLPETGSRRKLLDVRELSRKDICREADICRDSRPRQKRKLDKARDWIRIISWTSQHQDHIENRPERPQELDPKAHALKVYLEYKSQPKEVLF